MLKKETIRFKFLLIALTILFFFVSCAKKKSFREVLTNGSYRYWQLIEGISPYPGDSLYNTQCATKNDSCFLYFDNTGVFLMYLGDFGNLDHYHIPRWELVNDSTIYFFNMDNKIKEYSNDEIFLYHKMSNSSNIVVDTLEAIDIKDIPSKYRKYRHFEPIEGMAM